MLIVFSHVLAFSVLFIAAIWDLYTTDVPDFLGVIGVIGGISLHGAHAFVTGSIDPIMWSLGAGLVFSVFGWGMYLLGLWGGADAFAMSVLGFAAPYGIGSISALHGVNLFVNIMIVGFVYSLLFAFYRALRSGTVFRKTLSRIKEDERKISAEILLGAVLAVAAEFTGLNGIVYFTAIVSLVFLFRFLKVLEEEEMKFDKSIEDIEPGDVVSLENLDIGVAREKNMTGRYLELLRVKSGEIGFSSIGDRLEPLENRIGYPAVVGITEDEIEELVNEGVESVEVQTGARFVPVFPVALLITSAYGGGIVFLLQVF